MSKDQKRKFFWCRLLLYYINMLNGVGAPTPPGLSAGKQDLSCPVRKPRPSRWDRKGNDMRTHHAQDI